MKLRFCYILENNGVNQESDLTSNLRRYLLSAGANFSNEMTPYSFEPSLMFQYRDATSEASIDVNAKVYREMDFGSIWAGISYRNSFDGAEYITPEGEVEGQRLQQITPIVGINFNKFMFSYNYAHQANSVVFENGGFHQITLGVNFSCKKQRYHCNCPAVN